jgi:hypothetical protein
MDVQSFIKKIDIDLDEKIEVANEKIIDFMKVVQLKLVDIRKKFEKP